MKVIFLVARGLHLGYLGCYGNDWIDTPAFDRLAAEGVVFDQHIADRPDAAGARRAWFTGRYDLATEAAAPSPADRSTDLLHLLVARGIATRLIVCGTHVVDYTDAWQKVETIAPGGPEVVVSSVLDAVNRLAATSCWLLCVDLDTLLPPWNIADEFRDLYLRAARAQDDDEEAEEAQEPLTPLADPPIGPLVDPDDTVFLRLQGTYAGAVAYLDRMIGRLLDLLRESGLLDESVVVLTTDHGLALGEHGIVGPYRPWLHDELIHLPLIIRLPGAAEAGRRVSALTQPVDLMPTLLDAFGVPPPALHGRSLMPLMRGESEPLRAYACAGLRLGEAAEWALRTPEWSFLLPVLQADGDSPRSPQLYVKPDDRWEVNNVLQHHLELCEHLEQVLRGFVEATQRPGPLEARVLQDVEAELTAGATATDAPSRGPS